MNTLISNRTASTLRSDDIDGARPNKFKHSKRSYYYELKSPYTDHSVLPQDVSTIYKSPYEGHDIYHPAKVTEKVTHNPTLSPERSEVDQYYTNISKIAAGSGLQNIGSHSPQASKRFQSSEPRQSNSPIPVPPNYSIDSMRNPMYADRDYTQTRSLSQSPAFNQPPRNEYERNKALLQPLQPMQSQSQYLQDQKPKQPQSNLLRNSANLNPSYALPGNLSGLSPIGNNNQQKSGYLLQEENVQSPKNDLRDSVDHLKTHLQAANQYNKTPSHANAPIDLTPIKKDLHKFYGVTPPPSRYGEYYNRIHYEKPNNPSDQLSNSFYNNLTRRTHFRANEDPQFKKALNKFFNAPLNPQEQFQINRDTFYRGYTPVVGQQRRFVGVNLGQKLNKYGDPIQEKSYELDPISHNKTNAGIRYAQSPQRESIVQHGDPRYQANQHRFYN